MLMAREMKVLSQITEAETHESGWDLEAGGDGGSDGNDCNGGVFGGDGDGGVSGGEDSVEGDAGGGGDAGLSDGVMPRMFLNLQTLTSFGSRFVSKLPTIFLSHLLFYKFYKFFL